MASPRIMSMPNEIDQLRADLRKEADTLKAERASKHRRAEILHIAGNIAANMMATPIAAQASMDGIAQVSARVAVLVVDAVDRASSPITAVLPRDLKMTGGAQ